MQCGEIYISYRDTFVVIMYLYIYMDSKDDIKHDKLRLK